MTTNHWLAVVGSIAWSVINEAFKPANDSAFSDHEVALTLLVAVASVTLPLATFQLLGTLASKRWPTLMAPLKVCLSAAIAGLLCVAAAVQLDYIVYAVAEVGLLTVDSISMLILAATALCCAFIGTTGFLVRRLALPSVRAAGWTLAAAAGATAAIGIPLIAVDFEPVLRPEVRADARQRPNIVVVSADSVGASDMSFYGNPRQTTPFLDSIKEETWYAEEFYSNGCCTHGALTTLYTGLTVDRTRVAYHPDRIARERSTFHMAHVLHRVGYEAHALITQNHGEPIAAGLVDGFETSSFKPQQVSGRWFLLHDLLVHYSAAVRLFEETVAAARTRLGRLGGERKASDMFAGQVGKGRSMSDKGKIDELVRLFENRQKKPLFVHVHLMNAHGVHGTYHTTSKHFTGAAKQEVPWDPIYHANGVRDADNAVRRVYQFLEETGLLDETLLIFTSDHGRKWDTGRVPLIVRFPKLERVGPASKPRQMADIAPSLFEYLGIVTNMEFSGVPFWEDEAVPGDRAVISYLVRITSNPKPPSYRVKTIYEIRHGRVRAITGKELSESNGRLVWAPEPQTTAGAP